MTKTKKEFLQEEFETFSASIKKVKDIALFPSLEDVDIADLLIFFNITFSGTKDYRGIIKNLMEVNHIDVSPIEFEQLFVIIEAYVNRIKEFLGTN